MKQAARQHPKKRTIVQYIKQHDIQFRFSSWFVILLSLFVAAAVLFAKVAREVQEKETLLWDRQVLTSVHSGANHFLDVGMPILTDIGAPLIVCVLALVTAGLFVYKNEYRRACIILFNVSGALVLDIVFKSIFMRDRPDLWMQLVHETGHSFPSAHATVAVALSLAVCVALWDSRWRWWAVSAMGIYSLFVSYSRLYLGVHYPTDIIAGWLVALGWVTLLSLLFYSTVGRAFSRRLEQYQKPLIRK